MAVLTDTMFYHLDSTTDGQLQVGATYSPWFDCSGIPNVRLEGAFTGGSTRVLMQQASENYFGYFDTDDLAPSLGAGVTLPVPKYVRFRFEQTTAPTTSVRFTAKADSAVRTAFDTKPDGTSWSS